MTRNLFTVLAIFFAPAAAQATQCEKLPPLVCLESVRCTLDCGRLPGKFGTCSKPYFCRREQGPCEMAMSQKGLKKEDCEARPGCAFLEEWCFCECNFSKDCLCECGGGPPADCVAKAVAGNP